MGFWKLKEGAGNDWLTPPSTRRLTPKPSGSKGVHPTEPQNSAGMEGPGVTGNRPIKRTGGKPASEAMAPQDSPCIPCGQATTAPGTHGPPPAKGWVPHWEQEEKGKVYMLNGRAQRTPISAQPLPQPVHPDPLGAAPPRAHAPYIPCAGVPTSGSASGEAVDLPLWRPFSGRYSRMCLLYGMRE